MRLYNNNSSTAALGAEYSLQEDQEEYEEEEGDFDSADEGSAEVTGGPMGLLSYLQLLSAGMATGAAPGQHANIIMQLVQQVSFIVTYNSLLEYKVGTNG